MFDHENDEKTTPGNDESSCGPCMPEGQRRTNEHGEPILDESSFSLCRTAKGCCPEAIIENDGSVTIADEKAGITGIKLTKIEADELVAQLARRGYGG